MGFWKSVLLLGGGNTAPIAESFHASWVDLLTLFLLGRRRKDDELRAEDYVVHQPL